MIAHPVQLHSGSKQVELMQTGNVGIDVVSQEVSSATRNNIKQFLAHFICIRGNGNLNVIFLPVERSMNIDPLLLMQKTIGCLYTVFRYH